jgi:hypothetical protein
LHYSDFLLDLRVHELVLKLMFGANMGEVIQFVPKSERERARLIREGRAKYDSIFPSAGSVSEQQCKTPISQAVNAADAHRSDEGLLS